MAEKSKKDDDSKKMTPFELAAYAKEKFGVNLDPSHPRTELIKEIRRLETSDPKKPEKPDLKEKPVEESGTKKLAESSKKEGKKKDAKADK